jgi:hypothetical protein
VEEVSHPLRRLTAGPLELRDLLGLVDDSQAVGRVDQQVGRVLDAAARPDLRAQRVDEVRGNVMRVRPAVRLPAHGSDAGAGADALARQELGQGSGSIAWLAGQAEVLEPMPPHRQRRGTRHAPALVPDQQRRIVVRPDDQQRLLEPGIEPAQIREVGAVLAVGVDHEAVVPVRLHALAQPI